MSHGSARPSYRERAAWELGFGLFTVAGACLAMLLWFPRDIGTGFIATDIAGNREPGDAFFPYLLAILLLILGLAQSVKGALAVVGGRVKVAIEPMDGGSFVFLGCFCLIVLSALALFYWTGPVVVETMRFVGLLDGGYRERIDTPPFNYLGFIAGSYLLSLGLIGWIERRVSIGAFLSVTLVIAILILVFDVMLYNVALPPNSDY